MAGTTASAALGCPETSTYHNSYNVRGQYPEMYAQAVADTRTVPAPNYNFVSAWGESLKSGNDPKVSQPGF